MEYQNTRGIERRNLLTAEFPNLDIAALKGKRLHIFMIKLGIVTAKCTFEKSFFFLFWRHAFSVFVVLCVLVSLASVKTCQSKLVYLFTRANKTCQRKTRQRKLVAYTRPNENCP